MFSQNNRHSWRWTDCLNVSEAKEADRFSCVIYSRFFAFITKHPEDHRFACHVFMSEFSTEAVATAVG